MIKLYDGKLTDLLQNGMAHDPIVQSAAYAVLMEKRRIMDMADRTRTMTMIDELPENMLDVLAKEYKVDWWEPTCTPEEKRQTLKSAWQVRWTLGTKAAVETALSAIYPDAKVREWFEYGGQPYHFQISFESGNADIGSIHYQRVMRLINFYKNLRSHLDGIFFRVSLRIHTPAIYIGSGVRTQTRQYVRTNVTLPSTIAPPELYIGVGVWTQTRQHVRTIES